MPCCTSIITQFYTCRCARVRARTHTYMHAHAVLIPLKPHPPDRGQIIKYSRISNSTHTQVSTSIFFLLQLLYLGCTLITEVLHLDLLLQLLGQGHHGTLLYLPYLFSFSQEWWRTRISGSGVLSDEVVAVQAMGEEIPQWSMGSWRCFYEDFQTWNYFPQLLNYQDFQSIGLEIKGIPLHNSSKNWSLLPQNVKLP